MFTSAVFLCKLVMLVLASTSFSPEAASLPTSSSDLSMVWVIHRHGARAPLSEPYRNDPYRDEANWPRGFSQLTERGMKMMQEVGTILRERYSDFLPASYRKNDVYVRSTDVDRTLVSACALLSGLYPRKSYPDDEVEDIIRCPAVPIHSMPREMDPVLGQRKKCPEHRRLFEQLKPMIAEVDAKYSELYANLTELTGDNITTVSDAENIYNVLTSELFNDFALPNWTKQYYPEKLTELADYHYSLNSYNEQMARLIAGPFFHDMLGKLNERFANRTLEKLIVYSTHETVLANILKALEVYEGVPPYASHMIIELTKDGAVEFFFNNTDEIKKLKFGPCQSRCSLDQLEKYLDRLAVRLDKWEAECNVVK